MAETHSGTARSGCPPLRAATLGAPIHSPTLKDPRISGPQKWCAFTLHQLQYCVYMKGDDAQAKSCAAARKSFKDCAGQDHPAPFQARRGPLGPSPLRSRSRLNSGPCFRARFLAAFPLPTPGYSSPARSKQAVLEPAASRPGP